MRSLFKYSLPLFIIRFFKKIRFFYYTNKKFNHTKAQEYEFKHSSNYINSDGDFNKIFSNYKKIIKEGNRSITAYNRVSFTGFFNSYEDFVSFSLTMENKNCLEIGSGPYGILNFMPWIKKRFIIESLAEEYKQDQISTFGNTLFSDDIFIYSQKAEILEKPLISKIDGCIICRNMLDHCEWPYNVLENISQYAVSGSKLFLWTDLWHFNDLDSGHRNITKDVQSFMDKIVSLDYNIDFILPDQRGDSETLNFGCVATKI